ncbi:DNA topology modulation protein [Tuberibacillus sp. Marseille-P3662]|uniref:DNA topology modulation protein n=1 Tax=Tuberibacillus sp. Marseille-P3662 TaxID=1965358 RepID=UPI000A1CA671|nr:DNA topology modulation protein [Tuberibacillus sp. Marseille-P3662]
MKKIAIIGSGGSGKSTLARQLGYKLDIEVFHLDAMFWKPNWVGTPKAEQRRVQHERVNKDAWIFDGNYGSTMDIRLQAADTVIFLDISRVICVGRIIKRRIKYWNKPRPDMGKGCDERISFPFLKWVWSYPKVKKPEIMNKLAQLPDETKVVILSSPKEVERFLERVEHNETTGTV